RRHFGRAGHGEGRGHQHGLRGYSCTQLVQGAVKDLVRGGILDKLHQRFDSVGILDTLRRRHGEFLRELRLLLDGGFHSFNDRMMNEAPVLPARRSCFKGSLCALRRGRHHPSSSISIVPKWLSRSIIRSAYWINRQGQSA